MCDFQAAEYNPSYLSTWPPSDRKPSVYKVNGLYLEADSPSCVVQDRVFPVFDDESILLARCIDTNSAGLLLDVGTGSGILALTAASRGWSVFGTDINPRALACAAANAAHNHLNHRVQWVLTDLFDGLPSHSFDMIVSNPPFLSSPFGANIPMSSDGGSFGLKIFEPLVRNARRFLSSRGQLIVLGLTPGDGNHTLAEQIVREAFNDKSDSILIHDIYGEALPFEALLECYRGFPNAFQWAKIFENRGLVELRYLLIAVRKGQPFDKPFHFPSLKVSSFSGVWEGRLRKYRTWLALLRENHLQEKDSWGHH